MSLYDLHLLKINVNEKLSELKECKSRSFNNKKNEIRNLLVTLKSINLKINRMLSRG